MLAELDHTARLCRPGGRECLQKACIDHYGFAHDERSAQPALIATSTPDLLAAVVCRVAQLVSGSHRPHPLDYATAKTMVAMVLRVAAENPVVRAAINNAAQTIICEQELRAAR